MARPPVKSPADRADANSAMPFDAPLVLPALLAIILVVTVTCILRTLAAAWKREIEVHDLVRESREMRQRYIDAITQRRRVGNDVELVEEEP